MSHRIAAKITGVAGYVPPKVLTNADMEKMVNTNDEWIRTRTGIRERHIVENGTASSDLATEAAKAVLAQTNTNPVDIELIVVASVTPDMFFPATACLVQDRLGAKKAWGFDLSAACSGFAYALTVGAQFVGSGAHKKVLVIGSDAMSTILDYRDRATCVLFGDGAGAAVRVFLIFRTTWTVRAGNPCICRAAAREIRPRTKPSRKTCTWCIRKAHRCSSTPCGAWRRSRSAC
jgi:3-oxoacyl-[acyl-carrier-protein] synthase-3